MHGLLSLLAYIPALGHGSVLLPPSRNSIDVELPAWSNAKHPETGTIQPYTCTCTNGSSPCNNGQSCFWFSQGCTIGCKTCDGNGSRIPNRDACPDLPKPAPEETIEPQYRTANLHTVKGSYEDFYKFNPWRMPGNAPVYDPCGMAGGTPIQAFNAGEFNTTRFAKQGDLGSVVLPKRPTGATWKRGTVVKARFHQIANHGGGYQFRLCRLGGRPLTEACFQKTPLKFATPGHHVVRYADPAKDRVINATMITQGAGVGWMRWPLPNYGTAQCDYVTSAFWGGDEHCHYPCPGCGQPSPAWPQGWAADGACPTECEKTYKGLPVGNADPALFPSQTPGDQNRDFSIEDALLVPDDIPPGDYVLGWRWDAEMTSQIWASCSDVTII